MKLAPHHKDSIRRGFVVFLLMEMIDGEKKCEVFGVIAPTKTDWLISF